MVSRRNFIKEAGAGAATLLLGNMFKSMAFDPKGTIMGANDRIRLGMIGVNSRGLGLASAVIGMVFNEIGNVVMNLIPVKAIGIVAMAIVLLIGHVFNIGINTLGAYVHNSRLQFVEFFGKFYTGGGELFRPLGSEMKYYYISNQEVKK